MGCNAINLTPRSMWIGILLGSVLFFPLGCRNERVRAAHRSEHKPDPLLGKWVMIEDNGGGGLGTVADFRADGTVTITQKGKMATARYRREAGKAWFDRR